jgi:hypothetical protein
MRTNFSNSVRLHGVSIFCIASIIKQVSWEITTFSYEEYIMIKFNFLLMLRSKRQTFKFGELQFKFL